MFPRPLALTVVAFWLVMMGCLFVRELWPGLAPGEPPAVVVDRVDEANVNRAQDGRTRAVSRPWAVEKNGERSAQLSLSVEYHEEDDSFTLHGHYNEMGLPSAREPLPELHAGTAPRFRNIIMDSAYRVSRQGVMQGVDLEVIYDLVRP